MRNAAHERAAPGSASSQAHLDEDIKRTPDSRSVPFSVFGMLIINEVGHLRDLCSSIFQRRGVHGAHGER